MSSSILAGGGSGLTINNPVNLKTPYRMKTTKAIKKDYLKEYRAFGVSIFSCLNFKPRIMNYILPVLFSVVFTLSVNHIEKSNVNYENNLKESHRLLDVIFKN